MMNEFEQNWITHSRKWKLLTTYLKTVQNILKCDVPYSLTVIDIITQLVVEGNEEIPMDAMDLINGLLYLKEPLPTAEILREYLEKKEVVPDNVLSKRPSRNEIFEYLDELRESGVTNMFGATPYLMDEFSFDKKEAGEWLSEWMRTFEERHNEDNDE